MMMSDLTPKIFTPRQATQMLPLVKSIAQDIVELTNEIQQTKERLWLLGAVKITRESQEEIYASEVSSINESVNKMELQLISCRQELIDLGLVIDRIEEGYVDFPAHRRNEPIYLCWEIGETEVRNWHRHDQDCQHRSPLDLELIRQSGDHAPI
jgi:hypothetical protein